MPYIKQKRRLQIEEGDTIDTCGELNYAITKLIVDYLENRGEKYQTYNDIIGALEGIKLELYRRKIAPYEDMKKDANGDVY